MILVLLFAAAVMVPPTQELPADLARVLRDYERAWQARDPKALAELFTDDGFVLSNGKVAVRGRAAIVEAYSGQGGPLALRAYEHATSGDVGYIIGGYTANAGEEDHGKFVLALRKVDGRWMIAADIDNSIRRAPKPATTSTQ
jgi:ketosteroid isomerase-like protein